MRPLKRENVVRGECGVGQDVLESGTENNRDKIYILSLGLAVFGV
jgi:hypothetical protein